MVTASQFNVYVTFAKFIFAAAHCWFVGVLLDDCDVAVAGL
jgi:hypothetical protein